MRKTTKILFIVIALLLAGGLYYLQVNLKTQDCFIEKLKCGLKNGWVWDEEVRPLMTMSTFSCRSCVEECFAAYYKTGQCPENKCRLATNNAIGLFCTNGKIPYAALHYK